MPIRWGLLVALLLPYALIGVAPALAIRVFAFEAFDLSGPSMEPTMLNGDRFVLDKSAFGVFLPFQNTALLSWAAPEVGDVVVVRSPYDNLDVVKRIVALPGDRLSIREDVVYRNGHALEVSSREEAADFGRMILSVESVGGREWTTTQSALTPPDSIDEITVPEGHVYVLGDHRDRSNDSRNPRVGFIPFSRLVGRVVTIYWSSDAGRIRWDRLFTEVE